MPPPSAVTPRNRKRTRWDGYDYQSDGLYFVTICTHERKHLFGSVDGEVMTLNNLGLLVEEEWWRSGKIRREITLGTFIIMPNHLHGIVQIAHPEGRDIAPTPIGGGSERRTPCAPTLRPPRSLGSFIAGFKSATTKRINDERGTSGARVWQRNYYDHVVRGDDDLARIEHYMATNPERWSLDRGSLDES